MDTGQIDLNSTLELLQRLENTGEYVRIGHSYSNGKGGSPALALPARRAMDYCRNAASVAAYFELQVQFTVIALGNSLDGLELPPLNEGRIWEQLFPRQLRS